MTREYLPGICFTCKKCLFCFKILQPKKPCKCKKTLKPTRVNKPNPGQQIYSRLFTPNQNLPAANQFLFAANSKFQYNSNFNKEFSFTFCSACNSKFQRLKDKDKKAKKNTKMNKKAASAFIDIENISSPEFSDEEYKDIEEIKLHIIIEKRGGKKTSTSKILTIKPVEYSNVIGKINTVVQKALQKEDIKPTDYTISYKAVNARGPSSSLEDKCDFNEFIEDYKKVIVANKKMSVIVAIEDSVDEKKKSIEKRSKVSDESDLSGSEEEVISSRSKKKKKSRAIRESDLSKEQKTKAEVISALSKKYECSIHTTPCFVQDNNHLQLNPARLQLWSREILNNNTTDEILPNFPTFNMALSKKKDTQTQASAATAPIIIQMPPYQYPYSSFNHSDAPVSSAMVNHELPPIPSIHEFLFNLDKKYNCDTYSKFENNFVEEAITVNLIKDLSKEDMEKLGIVKMGWQIILRQAAQKF